MRVNVTIRLAYDVDGYEQAGRVLDGVMKGMDPNLYPKRNLHADVVGFETRPCKAAKFDQIEYAGQDMAESSF